MTNGILSIVKGGNVIAKIVCGCEGYNTPALAKELRETPEPQSVEGLWMIAIRNGVGCKDCLVVMDSERHVAPEGEELSPLYRAKFNDPKFNPRWECGLAAYVEVVSL